VISSLVPGPGLEVQTLDLITTFSREFQIWWVVVVSLSNQRSLFKPRVFKPRVYKGRNSNYALSENCS
jgi:hypothetical protein